MREQTIIKNYLICLDHKILDDFAMARKSIKNTTIGSTVKIPFIRKYFLYFFLGPLSCVSSLYLFYESGTFSISLDKYYLNFKRKIVRTPKIKL